MIKQEDFNITRLKTKTTVKFKNLVLKIANEWTKFCEGQRCTY